MLFLSCEVPIIRGLPRNNNHFVTQTFEHLFPLCRAAVRVTVLVQLLVLEAIKQLTFSVRSMLQTYLQPENLERSSPRCFCTTEREGCRHRSHFEGHDRVSF